MADMHILSGNNADEWTIVMHLPVPNVNNSVAVNFRTALVNSNLGRQVNNDGTFGRRSILPSGTGPGEITTAEEASLDAGALFEHVAAFRAEGDGDTLLQLQATSREFFAVENARIQAAVGSRLRYFGHTESAS